jgi:hypothetical protein
MTSPGVSISRPRGVVAGVLVAIVVANLALAGGFLGHHFAIGHRHSVAPVAKAHFRPVPDQSTSSTESLRNRAVTDLLAARATAISTHNRAAFLGTVDPRSSSFRGMQAAYFDNLQRVPFASWSYNLDASNEAPTDGSQFLRYEAPVWLPHVVLHYQLAGFDSSPTSSDLYYTFVQRGTQWYVGGDSDDADLAYVSARDLWDFGAVTVVRGKRSLVLGHPHARISLRALAAEADADVPRVSRVWGNGWAQRVVVFAPNTPGEMSKLLADNSDLSQIAAVATAELVESSHQTRPVGDRILVNPNNWVRLSAKGRQVVMTHETTHVATRAQSGPLLPDWLVEGFADYVGYLDTHVTPVVAAHELRAYLDGGHRLGSLPSDAAYNGSNKHLDLAYDESWLACRFIATNWGQATLVRLYRLVGTTTHGTEKSATDAGLRSLLHESLAQFTRDWQRYVSSVLR